MSEPDPREAAAFLELYGGLPRQGPGSAAETRAVFELLPPLGDAPQVVDAGCGSGASTLVLAGMLPATARIVAVDVLDVLLERLRTAATEAGVDGRIETRNGSMAELPERGIDLLWSEGAAYSVGVGAALRHWADVVRPGGFVVFSEACWSVPEEQRPAELVEFWAAAYPGMRDEAGVLDLVHELQLYEPYAIRQMPREVFWSSYFEPLGGLCDARRAGADRVMARVVDAAAREVAMCERFGDLYGYRFFVLRRR